jgi:hypothetical protein
MKNAEEISGEANLCRILHIYIDSLKGRYVLEKYFEPQKSLEKILPWKFILIRAFWGSDVTYLSILVYIKFTVVLSLFISI